MSDMRIYKMDEFELINELAMKMGIAQDESEEARNSLNNQKSVMRSALCFMDKTLVKLGELQAENEALREELAEAKDELQDLHEVKDALQDFHEQAAGADI